MNQKQKSQKGQALVLVALALVGLLGMVGLAVDGGMAFSDRRQAQNAADAGAMYAGRLYAMSLTATGGATQDQVRTQVATNGYTHNGTTTIVTLTTQPALMKCPDEKTAESSGIDFTVTIQSTVKTTFGQVVGINQVNNTVSATSRACKSVWVPIYAGDAVVGLQPSGDSVYNNGDNSWIVHGGSVYANANFQGKCGKTFELDPGYEIKAVGTVNCPNENPYETSFQQLPYPSFPNPDLNSSIMQMLPNPDPACDGTSADAGHVVSSPPTSASYADGSSVMVNHINGNQYQYIFSAGVFCIDNFDDFTGQDTVLSNAMLYVRDTDFNVKFPGGGTSGHGFAGTGRTSGPYNGLYLYIKMADPSTHLQQLEWNGNGYSGITGTILAPSTIFNYLGNSGNVMHSQVIAYQVNTLGTEDFTLTYNLDKAFKKSFPPSLQLLK